MDVANADFCLDKPQTAFLEIMSETESSRNRAVEKVMAFRIMR
jgi:hypothetical protein